MVALRERLPSSMLDWAVESTSAEAPRRAPPRTLKSRRREARHALVIIFLTRGTEPPRPLRDAAILANDAVNTSSSRRFKHHGRDEWQRRNGSDFVFDSKNVPAAATVNKRFVLEFCKVYCFMRQRSAPVVNARIDAVFVWQIIQTQQARGAEWLPCRMAPAAGRQH